MLGIVSVATITLASVAFASDVDVAVVDVTVPATSVTLAPEATGNITINMSVTGSQVGTATFEVYRDWTLSGGTFTGSNPQEFTVGPRATGPVPATTFSTSGTVSIAAGQADGIFTLAVGAFDITNTNSTGAKLAAGDPSNYQVTVKSLAPPADSTPPVISYVLNPASPDGSNGWYTGDVTLTWTVTENESSDSVVKTGCFDQNVTADQAATDYSCSATSTGGSAGPVTVSIKRDATAPTVNCGTADGVWHAVDVPIGCTASDGLSLLADSANDAAFNLVTSVPAGSETDNASTNSRTVYDNAGNSSAAGPISGNKIDKKAPTNIAFAGDIDDGDSFYFGFVPAAPTCTASDGGSGLDSCIVTGYSTAVGPHILTATATDEVGNSGTAQITYSVQAWTLSGFYQPVDMTPVGSAPVWNTVKNGSTVPLKFEIFAGAT
jgi:hypothetical protein